MRVKALPDRLLKRPGDSMHGDTGGIAQAVECWVSEEPDALALIDGEAALSRNDLLRWCRRTAGVFRQYVPDDGVDGPSLCAILLPRCWGVPLSLIASRFAGFAFLLLDAGDPPDRSKAIIATARPALLLTLTGAAVAADWGVGEEVPSPHADLEPLALYRLRKPRRLPPGAGHLVFTSGSSGEPKGVMLRDEPLLRTVAEQRALLGVDGTGPDARAPSIWALSPGFDASLSDIFCAILGQAPLLVFRDSQTRWRSLAKFVAHHGAARADLAPSLLRLVSPEALGLNAVIFGGERCDPQAARQWGSATRALQAYGPTEAAVCAMIARASPTWVAGLLGRPLDHQVVLLACAAGLFRVIAREAGAGPDDPAAFNTTMLTSFQSGPPPPVGGVEGEIWLAGEAIAIGYLDAPEAEARAFGMAGDLRVHRTGDMARWSDDELVWLGRKDRQIKLRGRRIAPEEVEAVAGAAWGAACLCLPWRNGLALALEPGEQTTSPDAAITAVGRHMGLRLHMVVVLDPWPRLPNGKIDVAGITARFAQARDGTA